jgi:hypothetical protein
MHLTVYNIKVLAYEAKLFYGLLFGCTYRVKNCFTDGGMAESALKIICQRTLLAGL